MQEQKICPYPGLRPFNEEESIFFRGREEHIKKIIGQLEEKKFVMLTGASGDGKSSLIYAGVIPNARAGFFKAKFNNWLIADFRPERTPLKNLAESLATKLNLEKATVESELSFGFSSLVNLYKKSAFHLDYNAPNYTNAEEVEKKKLKRKAANLFILVDQFEEFFTNPENYKNGQASNESQLIVNLLLETAKIALAEDLPIYIVCTMRSDYIGQCAAFRGLPEYIGYSQFFVPRLKRKEIHQVINEPALLSGNSISNRLVETLINEIGDGFDQLPVLQHALNRIWNKTNKGEYPMDLLQLAMVGGLPSNQLPDSDKAIFEGWLSNVAENKKLFFKTATLNAVLNAHAHELYESAHELYNTQNTDILEKEKAQLIIKTSFQCLTKIDDSRAVRNRMSLQEITNIINDSTIPVAKVDDVLRIFRLQGNTFIKPFATIDNEKERLAAETVLDITHESLIRNWDLLEKWAKEEHDNRLTFDDFYKQLQRWIANEKANGFLLPIGPLTFFENWFNTCKPNKYWLARYDSSNLSKADKLKKAEETLNAAKEFIGSSARILFFSRTVLKYGASKLIAVVGVILLVIACTYYYFDFQKKQNSNVIANITSKGIELLNSPDVSVENKADFLINYERLKETGAIRSTSNFENLLNNIENDAMAFDIGYAMLNQCKTIQSKDSVAYDIKEFLSLKIFTYLFHHFENDANTQLLALSKNMNKVVKLERISKFLGLCALMKNSCLDRDSAVVTTYCNKSIGLVKNLLLSSLKELQNQDVTINTGDFNYCISLMLSIDDIPKYDELINFLSPVIFFNLVEGNDSDSVIFKKTFYNWNKNYSLSCIDLPGEGQLEICSMLFSTLLDKDTTIMKRIMIRNFEFEEKSNYKPLNIYFSLLRHSKVPLKKFDFILNEIVKDGTFNKIGVIARLAQSFFETLPITHQHKTPNQNLICYFFTEKRKEEVWNYLFELLESQKVQNDEFKLELAYFYKLRGIYSSDVKHNMAEAKMFFDTAIKIYKTISEEFLIKKHKFPSLDEEISNSTFVLYPKAMTNFYYYLSCSEVIGGATNSHFSFSKSESFWNYIQRYNKLNLYESEITAKALFHFIEYEEQPKNYYPIMINICKKYINKLTYLEKNKFNIRGLVLFKIDTCLKNGDTTKAKEHFHSFYSGLTREFEAKGANFIWLKQATMQMSLHGFANETLLLLELINDNAKRTNILLEICNELQTKGPIENTFIYLDKLLDGLNHETKIGMGLFRVLGKIGGKEINQIAQSQLRKTPESLKPQALQNLIKGIAERGNYYEALQYLPDYISSSKELSLYNEILKAEIVKRENKNATNATYGNWNDAAFFKLDLNSEGTNLENVSLD